MKFDIDNSDMITLFNRLSQSYMMHWVKHELATVGELETLVLIGVYASDTLRDVEAAFNMRQNEKRFVVVTASGTHWLDTPADYLRLRHCISKPLAWFNFKRLSDRYSAPQFYFEPCKEPN